MKLLGLGGGGGPSKTARALALTLAAVAAGSAPALAQDACTVPRQPGVAFLVDDSGSMTDSDPQDLRRTATQIGIDTLPDGALVAAASFDTSARTFFRPTVLDATSRAALKNELFFSASGETDYELGFKLSLEHLFAMNGADKRALIFLSDGQPTSTYSTDATIASAGVPIYTVGFGDAPDDVPRRRATAARPAR
jgi:hypothetical protein